MINITSSEASEQEILEVFDKAGIKPEALNVQDGTEKPVEEEATDDTTVGGDKHSETDPEKDDKSKTEENDQQDQEEKPKEKTKAKEPDDDGKDDVESDDKPEKTSKGGWQNKIAKKTRQIESLQERLEEEVGSKTKLQSEIEQLRSEIAALKPKEEKKEEVLQRPVRPKKTDFDFDDAAYESAMDKYEAELDTYNAELRKKERAELESSFEEKAKQEETKKRVQQVQEEFSKRVNKDKESLEDWSELLEEVPNGHKGLLDVSPRAERYLMLNSKAPGLLMHYLANDTVNNGDAENDRLKVLDDDELVIELRTIESRLIAKRDAALKKAAGATDEEPDKETKKASADAAKPETKPKKAPEPPLETVGGRQSGMSTTDWNARLAKAAENGTYLAVRKQMLDAQAAARKRA